MVNCECNMFQAKGICYHTGYKPTFSTPPANRASERKIPEAELRRREYLKLLGDKSIEDDD